jgi:hypothetical protein
VAIIVGQAPMCAPLLRRTFWIGNGKSDSSGKAGSNGHQLDSMPDRGAHGSSKTGKKHKDPFSITQIIGTVNESEEDIVDKSDRSEAPSTISEVPEPPQHPVTRSGGMGPGEIMVSRRIDVTEHTQDADAQAQYKDKQKGWYYEVA